MTKTVHKTLLQGGRGLGGPEVVGMGGLEGGEGLGMVGDQGLVGVQGWGF